MEIKNKKACRIVISGKVHQVSYRVWTKKTAEDLGVFGWVRNRADGTVEAMFVGSENLVDEMVKNCDEGPEYAKVTGVEVFSALGITPFTFTIKPTVDMADRR